MAIRKQFRIQEPVVSRMALYALEHGNEADGRLVARLMEAQDGRLMPLSVTLKGEGVSVPGLKEGYANWLREELGIPKGRKILSVELRGGNLTLDTYTDTSEHRVVRDFVRTLRENPELARQFEQHLKDRRRAN